MRSSKPYTQFYAPNNAINIVKTLHHYSRQKHSYIDYDYINSLLDGILKNTDGIKHREIASIIGSLAKLGFRWNGEMRCQILEAILSKHLYDMEGFEFNESLHALKLMHAPIDSLTSDPCEFINKILNYFSLLSPTMDFNGLNYAFEALIAVDFNADVLKKRFILSCANIFNSALLALEITPTGDYEKQVSKAIGLLGKTGLQWTQLEPALQSKLLIHIHHVIKYLGSYQKFGVISALNNMGYDTLEFTTPKIKLPQNKPQNKTVDKDKCSVIDNVKLLHEAGKKVNNDPVDDEIISNYMNEILKDTSKLTGREVASILTSLNYLKFKWDENQTLKYNLVTLIQTHLPNSSIEIFYKILLALSFSQISLNTLGEEKDTLTNIISKRFLNLAAKMNFEELNNVLSVLGRLTINDTSVYPVFKQACVEAFSEGFLEYLTKSGITQSNVDEDFILQFSKSLVSLANWFVQWGDLNECFRSHIKKYLEMTYKSLPAYEKRGVWWSLTKIGIDFEEWSNPFKKTLLSDQFQHINTQNIELAEEIYFCASLGLFNIPLSYLPKDLLIPLVSKINFQFLNNQLKPSQAMQAYQIFNHFDFPLTEQHYIKFNEHVAQQGLSDKEQHSYAEANLKQRLTSLYSSLEFESNFVVAGFKPVDFYFPKLNIILELDGLFHYGRINKELRLKDKFNQRLLEKLGYKVVRLSIEEWKKHDYKNDYLITKLENNGILIPCNQKQKQKQKQKQNLFQPVGRGNNKPAAKNQFKSR